MAKLTVHLRDAQTGSPILFTAVFAGTTSGISDFKGDVVLDLAPGTYNLSVKSPMYVAAPGSPQSVSVPSEVTVQMARVTL